jgi:8-oxo-dGTP pyrophosphatase MutT (NUDIX family)
MILELFFERPKNFQPHIEVAGCYCEYEDKILFLKRHPDKPYGNTWTIPGGKLDPGETPHQGAAREIFEETGILIHPDELQYIDALYIRSVHNYIFHRFRKRFATLPILNLGLAEHTQSKWVTFSEALELPLIGGGREALESYQRFVER